MSMIDTQTLIWIAVFIGVLTRTLLPYLRKKAENTEPLAFDTKYLYTLVAAVIASIVTTNLLVMAIPPELLQNFGLKLLLFVFGWAFQHSTNDIFNEIIAT